MKAVVCEAFGGPEVLAVRDLPDPPPPGAGEVQVRIRARGAQYVDVLMLAGKYQYRPEPPFIPGSEAAGEIVAVGPEVTGFAPGALVMSRHTPNGLGSGAFATLGNCKAEACVAVPAGMSLEEAAVFRGAYSTAYHALVQKGRVKPGEWVLIHGAAGGIGIAAIQVAKLFGARVIATASTEEKRAACLAQGAEHAIDYRGGFRDAVKSLTGGKGVDIVYDPIGAEVFDESMRCLNWGARLLILGFLGGAPALARTNHLLIKGAEAIGVRIGGLAEFQPEAYAEVMREILRLGGEGRLRPLISHRFKLERAAEAIQAIIERRVIGKAVLVG
jgi:NADPH2:quinone reductase